MKKKKIFVNIILILAFLLILLILMFKGCDKKREKPILFKDPVFETMIKESLKKDKIFERVFSLEERKGTEFLFEALRKSFNSDIICSMIDEKSKDSNIIFLTGFGKIFPIVRGHMVLNNLQKTLGFTRKLILFFPGKYTDSGLSTFGKFEDNNYYRAFRICG